MKSLTVYKLKLYLIYLIFTELFFRLKIRPVRVKDQGLYGCRFGGQWHNLSLAVHELLLPSGQSNLPLPILSSTRNLEDDTDSNNQLNRDEDGTPPVFIDYLPLHRSVAVLLGTNYKLSCAVDGMEISLGYTYYLWYMLVTQNNSIYTTQFTLNHLDFLPHLSFFTLFSSFRFTINLLLVILVVFVYSYNQHLTLGN